MSFRDLRNFTEMMRTLGYSRLISMENFRTPNFKLIAEMLVWLVKRIDQEFDVTSDANTEEERVALIRSVAQFMATKANIKLNTKRLYQADGYAVIELLKITTLLHEALNSQTVVEANENAAHIDQLNQKINDLKFSRELASEITTKGAKLYEFLGQEVSLREERHACINAQIELSDIESSLDQAINETKDKVDHIKTQIENIAGSEQSLDKKIEKRQMELDRNVKRLQTLKKVKPAFLAEYEALEVELKKLHQEYVMRFRCLTYLQHQIDDLDHQEQDRIEEAQAKTRRLAESIRSDDSLKLFEEEDEGEGEVGKSIAPPPSIQSIQETANRLRTATGSAAKVISGRRRVYGSMNPSDDSSSDDDDDDDDDDK
uniref:Clusterin-associated protein 1 n=1 Tax=Cacopsylla melanoneura TaxID=428564 RepID=A0A8D8TLN9_9HEMI